MVITVLLFDQEKLNNEMANQKIATDGQKIQNAIFDPFWLL